MTSKRNAFEGGTSGATIVHSPTNNTGGASGDPFAYVVTSGGTTLTFDNTYAAHGTMSGKVTPASSGAGYFTYDSLAATRMATSFYLYLTALPAADTYFLWLSTASVRALSLHMGSTGQLKLRDRVTSSSASIWTSPSAFPLNQWVRVDVWFQLGTGTANAQIKVAYFVGDSTTATQSTSLTNADMGTDTISAVSIGKYNTSTYATPLWVDDIRFDDTATDILGVPQAGLPPTVTTTSTVTVASGATVTLSASATSAASTITSLVLTQTSGPTTPTLSGTGTTTPATRTFVSSTAGTYVFTWTATDANNLFTTATQTINVTTPTARPNAVISNPGSFVNQGGATSLFAALADESDATYIESPSSPSGSSITLRLQPQPAGAVTVNPRHQKSDDTTVITALYELLQGPAGTVIASRSYTVTTSWVDATPFTTTTSETATISDFNNLYLRITAS